MTDLTLRAWRYFDTSRCSHALGNYPPGGKDFEQSVCGIPAFHGTLHTWRGTATTEERDTLADLPRCKRCLDRIDKGL